MPVNIYAHSVGFDKDFTATLHFAPDDKPVAGPESEIRFIDIREPSGQFQPEQCDCRAAIHKDGRLLTSLRLSAAGQDLAARYIFPAAGTYEIILSGEPRSAAGFSAFNISYPLQIDRAKTAETTSSGDYWLIAVLITVLAGTGLAIGLNRARPS